ncbi:amidohydrolase family protein [Sporothrix schenckii 1099-18]|uniref:Amidohydrolase family protein n=1 Tax=Sporothrix schenckii 1099-18 TaxID=1397361 RepID=A0A0F2LZL6_SPOSC|nr:amidohydrolase family protein [Sporothrix schenckii 1099-18]KJR81346.1 amidohydrolase family protein [Sporothrix schenckii 1099-18]
MAPETQPGGNAGRPPPRPWPPWAVASLAAAGALALAGLYMRGGELSWPALPSRPDASPSATYCYDSVTTLADDPSGSAGPHCFSVRNGRFASVGPLEALDPEAAASASVSKGHVIPGLWDGHGHLIPYGEFLASIDLFGSSDDTDVRHRLHTYLETHPDVGGPDKWLRGFGWDQMAMGGMPTAELLDTAELRGLYIMLDRVDGHCIWVSKAVLSLLPDDLADIPGGEIVRDPGLGVFCDNAMDLVMTKYPQPSRVTKTEYIRLAMREMRSMGLVGMHDAGVVPEDLRLYQELAGASASGRGQVDEGWTMRVYAMAECPERNTLCLDDVGVLRQQEGRSAFLSVRSVKLFADGALGSWGSALIDPYSDRPDTSGSLLVDAATLARLTHDWAAAGFQVNIHAIGDLANRYAVDAFEAALVALCQPPAGPGSLADCQRDRFRFRIEHAQIIHPHDQARIHALGILPSIQPTHATSDMAYAARRLGPARTRDEAYRMRSFFRDALLPPPVLGSDFPIEPPDPFQGIYAAVARRSPHTGLSANGTTEPWYPAEALTLHEALVGFTQGPAYGAFLDGRAGVIQPGALADWVVLDRPLAEYDLEELRSMKVRETWVGGTRVYQWETLPAEL